MDKLQMFLGMPFSTDTNCKIKSPTVRSIAEIGEGMYNFYLSLASFNKDELVKALFNPSFEEMKEIQEYDDYNFLISTPLLSELERALSFFTGSNVIFLNDMFLIDGLTLVSLDNYKEISRVVQELNGIQEKEKPKFSNKTAEKNYYLMLEMEQKYNSNESLSLKDICSILCNAEGNGINVFNIGDLTIYQLYEHFERLSVKESHRRMLQVWANGHLKDDIKLQDWLVKTKL
ncbi:hypothetical protein A616_17385 [Brevibacillus brevis X23]|nr:hypothetical protein A616_17385 [Brevibacillus brevis X23]